MTNIKWQKHVKDSNYEAAESYLTLIYGHHEAEHLIKKFKEGKVEAFTAKDILRAAKTQALPKDIEHVATNMLKIKNGEELNPLLICRTKEHTLIIADGMHRVSAAWYLDEDTPVYAVVIQM